MKKTFTKLTAAVLVSAAFTTAAFGDVLTSAEYWQYRNSNSSYDTLQVISGPGLPVYELFNSAATAYSSTTGQSVATYNNAADFYAERGFKSLVSDWTVSEDSQIVGMFRGTGFAHSLNLINSTGTVWNTTAGQGQSYGNQGTWIASLDSSRNIDVGAIGAVNMTLTVWVEGNDGSFHTVYGDRPELNGGFNGFISMVAYDVTDLIKAMGYAEIENAFMFTWEDSKYGTGDFDYNDMVYIMTNVTPNMLNATPEPATMLIIGLGLAGLGLARRRRKK
ncbi:hypothetical protein FACS189454_01490 [Planctomycetales bacterium]|nr:hypothetical protein FACS189454_01490 [Planctomycetales bacterium]